MRRFIFWSISIVISCVFSCLCNVGLSALTADHIPAVCMIKTYTKYLSPRYISNALVFLGPLWTWVPLVFLAASVKSLRSIICPELILMSTIFYLFIPFFRWCPYLFDSGWDISGHIFIYGLQLIPYWLTSTNIKLHLHSQGKKETSSFHCDFGRNEPSEIGSFHTPIPPAPTFGMVKWILTKFQKSWRCCFPRHPFTTKCYCHGTFAFLRIIQVIIFWFTFCTSAFFHTPTEVLSAWTLFLFIFPASRFIHRISTFSRCRHSVLMKLFVISTALSMIASILIFLKLFVSKQPRILPSFLAFLCYDVVLCIVVYRGVIMLSRKE